jgi:hypothetical protein
MPTSRWQFAEVRFRGSRSWTWRHLSAGGALSKSAVMLESFGAVVRDAIRNGFDPQQDSWDVTSATYAAHFEPQLRPTLLQRPPIRAKSSRITRPQRELAETCASTLREP